MICNRSYMNKHSIYSVVRHLWDIYGHENDLWLKIQMQTLTQQPVSTGCVFFLFVFLRGQLPTTLFSECFSQELLLLGYKTHLLVLPHCFAVNVKRFLFKRLAKMDGKIISWHWQGIDKPSKRRVWVYEINRASKQLGEYSQKQCLACHCLQCWYRKSHLFLILIGRWESSDIDELDGVPKVELLSTEKRL